MRNFLLVVIGLCLLLAVTNPDMDGFLEWAHVKIAQEAETSVDAMVSNMLTKPLLKAQTTRKDFLILSVFSVDNIAGEDMEVLGILNQFIRLK